MIYYVHAPELGMVKIGFATDVSQRFSKIQSDSPTRLVILAAEDGDLVVEAERHARFASLRRRGEWFSLEGELAEFVASLSPFEKATKRRAFGPTEMALATGWGKSRCSQILSGKYGAIRLETAVHIYRTCGLKMGALANTSDEQCEAVTAIMLGEATPTPATSGKAA
jgi:hypothetical protein